MTDTTPIPSEISAIVIGNDDAWGIRTLPANLVADALKSVGNLTKTISYDLGLPKFLDLLSKKSAALIVIQAANGELFGAVALTHIAQLTDGKMFCVDVDVRLPVNAGVEFANVIEYLARRVPSDGVACDRVSIAANGPFPCPPGFEYQGVGSSGAHTMTMRFQWS